MITVNRPYLDRVDAMAFIKGHFYEYIPNLEKEFNLYTNMKHNIFTCSCRSALYLAYIALKLKGEVIVPPLTCSIALLPILWCDYKPYFVDIDRYNYNIDPEKINEAITNKTCAIQVIHLAGNPCDMKPIKELAEDHNLVLIEDCAQSLGAEYHGEKVGSFGDISCFSFTKNLYSTGGGMISTNNQNLALKIKTIQNNFCSFPKLVRYYRFTRNFTEANNEYIFNPFHKMLFYVRDKIFLDEERDDPKLLYKPSNVEASICLTQFEKLKNLLKKRIKNASVLTKKIKNRSDIEIQKITNDSKHVFTKFMIKTDKKSIDIIRKLQQKGIDAKHLEYKHGCFYQERFDINPLYFHFDSIIKCNNYLEIHDYMLSLPISPNMSESEILIIAKELGKILGDN
jgi:perosamine synthetase